jgi:hypothetical protein
LHVHEDIVRLRHEGVRIIGYPPRPYPNLTVHAT